MSAKSFWMGLAVCAAVLSMTVRSYALPMSFDDVWDVSQGAVVTDNSRMNDNSRIVDMFGGTTAPNETGCALFYDNNEAGFVHWVEWQTAAPVTLTAFNLVAAHDSGGGRDANERGFSCFTLYAWVGGTWEVLYEYSPSNPYGGGETYTDTNFLELFAEITATTAQEFRAEFVQYGDRTAGSRGPRILELDGYATTAQIPEPATMALLALGGGALALLRRHRRSA